MRWQMDLGISHIYREDNQVADMISKLQWNETWIGGFPDFISSQLYIDLAKEYFSLSR
ncbi:hypothetical protein ACS0TY_034638 [Phlomoides rotata]